jgi:hypothetical protein
MQLQYWHITFIMKDGRVYECIEPTSLSKEMNYLNCKFKANKELGAKNILRTKVKRSSEKKYWEWRDKNKEMAIKAGWFELSIVTQLALPQLTLPFDGNIPR